METEVKEYLVSFSYDKKTKISEALVANALRSHQVEVETVTINEKTNRVTVMLSSPDEAKKIKEMSTVLIAGKPVHIKNRDRPNIYMLRARNIPRAIIVRAIEKTLGKVKVNPLIKGEAKINNNGLFHIICEKTPEEKIIPINILGNEYKLTHITMCGRCGEKWSKDHKCKDK
ncbi:hypothetical protein ROZALSC1DRAFT_28981, partial [Rozella allomycis CSF55]